MPQTWQQLLEPSVVTQETLLSGITHASNSLPASGGKPASDGKTP